MLTRLAHTCFQARKFGESERYFKIAEQLVHTVTKNPLPLFNAKMNLLTFYLHSNIKKAREYAEVLLVDLDDLLPQAKRSLLFTAGNIYLLDQDYLKAKHMLRECLRLVPKAEMEGQLLNNLALACHLHAKTDQTKVPEEVRQDIVRDEGFIADYF